MVKCHKAAVSQQVYLLFTCLFFCRWPCHNTILCTTYELSRQFQHFARLIFLLNCLQEYLDWAKPLQESKQCTGARSKSCQQQVAADQVSVEASTTARGMEYAAAAAAAAAISDTVAAAGQVGLCSHQQKHKPSNKPAYLVARDSSDSASIAAY